MHNYTTELGFDIAEDIRMDIGPPQISVVVPLYNYAHFVGETLASIENQTARSIELIIVDDVSTDDSYSVARAWLLTNKDRFCRCVLARNLTNRGLPYTRNVGFSIATSEYVFPLDADNLLYPPCLERCFAAIKKFDASVAYPIIERFGAERGLINVAPWRRDTFAYGNQIDAMALIRRRDWSAVGGYDPSMRLGWEDYELWLRFCDANLSGVQVPEILGRYRVHARSMTKTLTAQHHTQAVLKQLVNRRYPWTHLDLTPAEEKALRGEMHARPSAIESTGTNALSSDSDDAASTTENGSSASNHLTIRQNVTAPAMIVPFGYSCKVDDFEIEKAAGVVHIYYSDMARELCQYLYNLPNDFRLFVSTDSNEKVQSISREFRSWGLRLDDLRVLPNRGRDVAAKLLGFGDVYKEYDLVLHLHAKKSLHIQHGADWRRFLYQHLMGSPLIIQNILTCFKEYPQLGMLFPPHWEPLRRWEWTHWGGNFEAAQFVARQMGVEISPAVAPEFPSGSMFWARTAALRPLINLSLSFDDFEPEMGQTDGTLAHAIERLYAMCCERAGFRWAKTAIPHLYQGKECLNITNRFDLQWFVTQLTCQEVSIAQHNLSQLGLAR